LSWLDGDPWRKRARHLILGLAISGRGILGMAAIFHNQHHHLLEVKALEAKFTSESAFQALGNLAAAVA